jgi:F1F0 ATPase subunit 2
MSETLSLAPAFVLGLLLGVFFFGGLWYTVRRGVVSKEPVLWFFGSLILRICITLTGFYYISGNQLERLIVCLIGFGAARIIVRRLIRAEKKPAYLPRESGGAS